MRRIKEWSFISRPRRRFEFGSLTQSIPTERVLFTPRNNFHKGLLADGAWTESDSPLKRKAYHRQFEDCPVLMTRELIQSITYTTGHHPLTNPVAVLMHDGFRGML